MNTNASSNPLVMVSHGDIFIDRHSTDLVTYVGTSHMHKYGPSVTRYIKHDSNKTVCECSTLDFFDKYKRKYDQL